MALPQRKIIGTVELRPWVRQSGWAGLFALWLGVVVLRCPLHWFATLTVHR